MNCAMSEHTVIMLQFRVTTARHRRRADTPGPGRLIVVCSRQSAANGLVVCGVCVCVLLCSATQAQHVGCMCVRVGPVEHSECMPIDDVAVRYLMNSGVMRTGARMCTIRHRPTTCAHIGEKGERRRRRRAKDTQPHTQKCG